MVNMVTHNIINISNTRDINIVSNVLIFRDSSSILFVITIIILCINVTLWGNNLQTIIVLFVCIVGYIFNRIFCSTLQKIAQDVKKVVNKDKTKMPSGHTMMAFYLTVFVILLLWNNKRWNNGVKCLIISLYLILSACVFIGCLVYRYHTFAELVVGAVIGSVVSLCFYKIAHTLAMTTARINGQR
jgi:membrane-associated phospholipid phosphatase